MSATLFRGGTILSFDPASPAPEALAVEGERVAASGSFAALSERFPGAEVIDLGGDALLPGFIDVHHHFVLSALLAERPSLRGATTLSAVLDGIRAAIDTTPEGFVVVTGVEPGKLAEDRYPTLAELDAIAGGRPVVALGFSLHEAAVSSAALEAIGGPEVWRGEAKALITDRKGQPTGELREHAVGELIKRIVRARVEVDRASAIERLREHARSLSRLGLTHLVDPGLGPTEEQLLLDARAAGLALEVDYLLASEQGLFRPASERIGPEASSRQIKVFVDGGAMVAMSWTAGQVLKYTALLPFKAMKSGGMRLIRRALKEQVLPGPDGRYHSGFYNFDQAGLDLFARNAFGAGFSLAMHASGTDAIEMGLVALGQRAERPAIPDQLVHFLFPKKEHVARAAALGACVVLQPAMVASYAHDIDHTMPAGDFEFAPPLAAMEAAGVFMVLSSDAPIATADPRAIIDAAVRPARGEGLRAESALLRMTKEAGKALGREDKGHLAPGAVADLVRLSGDPRAASLGDLAVVATWSRGARA